MKKVTKCLEKKIAVSNLYFNYYQYELSKNFNSYRN